MGDTGSILLGLINSVLGIKFVAIAGNPESALYLDAAPAIGFAILMIPLFDTLRVFTLRIFNRRSPFSPDRNHVHHFLLDLGFSHKMVTFTCVAVNIAFIAAAYFLRHLQTTAVIGILFCCIIFFISTVYYYSRQKNKGLTKSNVTNTEMVRVTQRFKLAAEPTAVEVD
jgi:UDP-N-acetylmuramyl pentapeptide phosphotransferase/UDP-N-acetylglucosamine-1-phosphate transferase